jgi:hypothetical protein
VTILRASDTGVLDGYGRPLLSDFTPIEVDVPAWVQQLGMQEQQLLSQAGAEHVSHRIFMDPTDVTPGDMIRWALEQTDFELLEVKDPDGTGHHLEIIANEIVPVPPFDLVS